MHYLCKMHRVLIITIVIILAFLTRSCTNAVSVPGACFNQRIKPIIISNCTRSGCHNAKDHEKRLDLTTYAGIMKIVKAGHPLQSDLYTVIRSRGEDRMPPDHSLSTEEILAIKSWISLGARENDCAAGSCDSTNYTYSGQVQSIIKTNCLGCHASGTVPLNTYQDVQSVALSGKLTGCIKQQAGYKPMPEGYKLSDCEINVISKWVAAGAPNN